VLKTSSLSRLPNAHYVAIGKVASNWAAFEHLLNSSLWELAKVDDEAGACITSQIGNSGRSLDALASLVRLRGGGDAILIKINKFAEKSGNLSRRRNRIIHDPWVIENPGLNPGRFEISAVKKLIFGYQLMPTKEVIDVWSTLFSTMSTNSSAL
jgi:hypothetical protein